MTRPGPNESAVLSYIGLRRWIGAIGLALPFVLPIGVLWFGGIQAGSISGYYYTDMRNVLVGILCAIGIFMLSYRFGSLGNRVSNVAAVAAIGVALAPTPPPDPTAREELVGVLHGLSAVVFFLALAYFCFRLFPKPDRDGPPTANHLVRVRIYRLCGGVIVACLVAAIAVAALDVLPQLRPLYWLESVAVVAFAFSWIVKGRVLLGDGRSVNAP